MTDSSLRRPLALSALSGVGLAALVALAMGLACTRPSPPPVSWEPPVRVASGEGYRGPWRMNESVWQFVDDPTVALDDDTAGVLWTDHVRQDLFFQAYGPDGQPQMETPVNVSRNPETFSWLPRMVMPHRDTIYVLWQEIIFSGGSHGGDVLFARSTDGGRTFSTPRNLSQSPAGDGKGRLTPDYWHNGSLDLTVGPHGHLYTAWTEYEGRLWLRRSTDGGAHFSETVHVTGTDSVPARGPALAVGPDGTVHLAWTVGETPTADIHYAHSDTSWSSFTTPQRVAPSDGLSDAPKLQVDRTGTVHLAYGERPSGLFHASHVRYTHAPDGAPFEEPTVLSHPSDDAYRSAAFPYLRLGPDDRLYVLWELFPSPQDRPRAFGYTSSHDGGTTFSRPSVLPGSAESDRGFHGSQQGLLMEKLAVNAAGDLAVVNSTFRPGAESHIWLYRGHATDR